MFEQRQNELLGANNTISQNFQPNQYATENPANFTINNPNSLSNSKVMEEINMRKRQQ
jgi:hypothetical protein